MSINSSMEDIFKAKITATEAAELIDVSVQYIHKHLKLKGLQSLKSQNRVYFGHNTSKELLQIQFEPRAIAFQIVKGGTGKTSLAHSFAIRANLYGARVLCIDIDQQGNLTHAFNHNANESPVMIDIVKDDLSVKDCIVNISPGLDLIPSRIENAILDNFIMLNKYPLDRLYKNLISEIRGNYDLIVFDCPPALGQSVAAVSLAADTIISPLTPEQFSLSGLKITYDELNALTKKFANNAQLKIVLNKFDTRTALSSEVLSTLLNDDILKTLLCKSFVRSCQEFPNAIYAGTNIFSSLKNSSAKEDIDLFTKEILNISNLGNINK